MNIDVPFPSVSGTWQADLAKRIKESEAWWQTFSLGGAHDFSALDEVTMGRLWFLSHAKSQEFTVEWFKQLRLQVSGAVGVLC